MFRSVKGVGAKQQLVNSFVIYAVRCMKVSCDSKLKNVCKKVPVTKTYYYYKILISRCVFEKISLEVGTIIVNYQKVVNCSFF